MGNTGLIEDPARPTTDPEAFAAVLAAANARESWAWHHLHGTYARRVRAYLRAQGAPEPDDLTSEVFLKVFARLATFSGTEAQFRSWLFTVAHHQLIDDARKRRRRPQASGSPVTIDGPVLVDVHRGDVHQGAEHSAEQEALELVGEQWARDLIASLPDAQREVLALRVIADLPLVDVAAVLGKRVGAVKSLQHRALAALRRALDDGTETIEREAVG